MYAIISPNLANCKETALCRAFLLWQGKDVPAVTDFEFCIRHAKGQPSPIIIDKDRNIIAIGFNELHMYWNDKGLWLC